MVLRSGIIIPFQFRDTKKLLMIGVPEENRNLNIWDLKNVVRAAFGIYNFEFRNKKIGFNIPDELLLHYLAQRHDLTNFVIEISQALDDGHGKEIISYEPSCSMAALKQHHVPLPQRSSESVSHDYGSGTTTACPCPTSQPNSPALGVCNEPVESPLEHTNNSSDHASNADSSQKLRITQAYSERTPESLTQSIDPLDIIPKAESESEAERAARAARYQAREQQQQQQHQQQHQQAAVQAHAAMQHTLPPQQFFPNYSHSLLGGAVPVAVSTPMSVPNTPQQSPYTPGPMSRFRIYDAALDNYAVHTQCRCGAQKVLSASPTPEPTNLCQQPSASIEAVPPSAATAPLSHCEDEEQVIKFRLDKTNSAPSAELHMPPYEACTPKMDYDAQDELPDSPHSQQHLPQPPHQLHHPHEYEYMLQQQQQHLAMLQQQEQQHQQQQQQQQHHQQQPQHSNAVPIGASGTNNIRQRKERMSKRQKELYVHFLQQHQFINDHRRNDPVLDPYWLKLANLLNAVPQGAVKHVTEWKQTFDNWRYRIFLYARYNSKLQDEEAQNPRNCKPLTRTDKQAYNIWITNPDTAPPDLEKMRNVFLNLEDTTTHQE